MCWAWCRNLLILALLAGCAGGEDKGVDDGADVVPGYNGANNSKMMDGGALGAGGDNTPLVKNLQPSGPVASFKINAPSLVRKTVDTKFVVRLIFEVKNISPATFCNVRISGPELLTEEGAKIQSTLGDVEIIGSVGLIKSKYFRWCLAPDEMGYGFAEVVSPDGDIWSNAAKVKYANMLYTSSAAAQPTLEAVPTSYTVEGGKIVLSVSNGGLDDASIYPHQSIYILMDPYGNPVWADTFNPLDLVPTTATAQGGPALITSENVGFDGSSSKVRVHLSFAAPLTE